MVTTKINTFNKRFVLCNPLIISNCIGFWKIMKLTYQF